MEIKTIVFSMMIILPALFLVAEIYRKKETTNEKLEARYFELMKKYHSNPSDQLMKEIRSIAFDMSKGRGLSQEEAQKKFEEDLRGITPQA
ncbi:MAG: hypothetical protein EP326_05360 [Deltaproteobacteria bacterium]|nr:MAG: hypothetical protein EP326_05360 [Deltaproteobacteria bacterium]TNF25716.1 MAG: hypothetical protein EP319_15545 [Deltaproteobacteria bacterium]